MFGTKRSRKSQLSIFLVMVVFVTSTLTFTSATDAGGGRSKPVTVMATVSNPPMVFQSSPTYDSLLQDNSSGDMLRFNSTTGAYQFSRCSDGYTLTGTGSVSTQGCLITLTHFPTDRRLIARLDTCAHSGTVSLQIYALGTTFTIIDSDTTNNPGAADPNPPQIGIAAPNGSELVDTGSTFTISWNASDNIGITSQDLLLSTDSGASFATLAQGLAGDVTQYSWIAPLISTNQNVRVRLIAHDAACNTSVDDSDANFTVVSPNASFTHIADTPTYMLGGGFNSMIHLCNTSPDTVTVEIGVCNRFGTGLVSPPSTFTLTSGQVRAINLNSYLSPGTPSDPGDPNVLMGSIRLRHTGSADASVRAIVAVDHNNEDTSFTVPFTYVNSQQSPNSTMQCAPLYYFDDVTSAWLSMQNTTNAPVAVNTLLHYGTGASGTPNGDYALPTITVPAQGSVRIDLSQFADKVQNTNWGTVVLNAPPQTIVANTIMLSHANHLAFNSNFVDPAMCASATKIVGTLKLDYAMNLKSCLMVSNTSSADTRNVTVSFQTDNGVSIPSQTFSLAPGQQKLVELVSQQILSAGASTNATAKISYLGNAADIVGGAVSMSAANGCAIPAQFTEPRISDGRRLVAPFFRFDERTSGILQVANLGAADIKAGVVMKFADTTLPTLNTDLLTIPANGTATIDLQSYFSLVDDGVAARGCVELLHNGAAGSVTATFTAIGRYNDLSLEVPLEGGPAFNATDMALFPNNADVQNGDAKPVAVMTGGGLNAPTWSVSAGIGDPGSIAPTGSSDATIYKANYNSPSAESKALNVTVTANASSSGGGTQSGNFSLSKVKVQSFTTSVGNGRMKPDDSTPFTITGKADWPDGTLTVKFKKDGINTPEVTVSRSQSNLKILTGNAPPNSLFIGDAQVIVFQDGAKISKDNTGAAYYAYDPPGPATAVSPDGYNRLGGIVTITGTGYRTFGAIKPEIVVEDLSFTINTVNSTQVNGLVLRAPKKAKSCQIVGQNPCKRITVRNPGGRDSDRVTSNIPLYNLKPGPAPVPESRVPDFGFSIGGTPITIRGDNLDFADNVTVGGTDAPIVARSEHTLEILTLPHTAGANNSIIVFDVDDTAPGGTTVPGGSFRYDPTPVTELGLPNKGTYIVGPGEGVDLVANSILVSQTISCITSTTVVVSAVPRPPILSEGILAFKAVGSYDCRPCTCSAQSPPCPVTIGGTINFTLANTSNANDTRLRLRVIRTTQVMFDSPPPQGLPPRQCGNFF